MNDNVLLAALLDSVSPLPPCWPVRPRHCPGKLHSDKAQDRRCRRSCQTRVFQPCLPAGGVETVSDSGVMAE